MAARTLLLLFVSVLSLAHRLSAQSSDQAPRIGLVTVSMASLRNAPAHASELETQVLCGTPVEILDSLDGWLRVRVPDGYEAYAHPDHIALKSPADMRLWRSAPRLIVTATQPQVIIADTLIFGSRNVVADASLCCIYEGSLTPGATFARVLLPDGRSGFLPAGVVEPFADWAQRSPAPDRILATAYALRGTPYLWGGATRNGVDCSGLSQLSYLSAGILLPRNASQQALAGEMIDVGETENLRPGDLLFFSGSDPSRITHVAIYDRDNTFIHSLGTVHLNSLSPDSPIFLRRNLVRATRPVNLQSLRLSANPAYFNL